MKTFICASLFGVLSILCASVSAAQEIVGGRVVEGTVVSDMGSVISNAKVSVKGSNTTTLSGADGHYSIVVNSEEDVLVFERDGYTAAELQVGQNKVVDATMTIEDLFAIDLEDLMNTSISSSSFFTLSAKETPGYIYSRDMCEVHGQRSLIEIANMSMPGVSEGAHPDTRIIGVRGMKTVDNSKTMVMFDGQNLNLRSNVGYGVGLSSKLLGDVKTLEVSLGPNAIVHGSGAISGYINMVPKNGYNDKGFYATVEKEYEANAQNMMSGISRAEVGYGFGNEKRNAYIYAGYYFSNGWQADSNFTTKKITREMLENRNVNYTKRANMRFSAHTNFDGLAFNFGYMQNYLSGYSSKPVEQDVFQRQLNLSVKYNKDVTEYENVAVRFSNELNDLGRIQSTQAGGAESHIEAKIIAKTTRLNNNSLAIGALIGGRKFYAGKFYFGHDIDPTEADNAYIKDPLTGNSYENDKGKADANYLWASGQMPNGRWNEFAVFAEDIYKFNEQLVAALGLRYDRFYVSNFDDVQDNLAPRLALSYIINDSHVVKASYQQGFRTFDFYSLGQTVFQKAPDVIFALSKANKDYSGFRFNVVPEKLHSVEVNYIGDFANNMLKIEANAYFNLYKDIIDYYNLVTWTSDKYLEDNTYIGDYTVTGKKYFSAEEQNDFMTNYVSSSAKKKTGQIKSFGAYVNNGEDVKIIGGELIATLNAPTNTLVRASYSLNKSLTDSYGDNIQHPSQMLKLDATQYFFSRKLMLNAQFEFEPALEDNEKNHENYHDVYFESRTMLDGAVAYRLTNAVTIQASVNNILGEDRPGITYKPDMNNNYTELTNIGCNERRYWLSVLFAL